MGRGENKEYANLYMRGFNEAASGAELGGREVLDVLGVFSEDDVRWYLIGFLEGIEGRIEEEIQEYEMLEASIAFVLHEGSVSVLEVTEDMLQLWMEDAPRDLSTEVDLHIVNDEDEILHGGRITAVEFKDAGENPQTGLAVVTVQK